MEWLVHRTSLGLSQEISGWFPRLSACFMISDQLIAVCRLRDNPVPAQLLFAGAFSTCVFPGLDLPSIKQRVRIREHRPVCTHTSFLDRPGQHESLCYKRTLPEHRYDTSSHCKQKLSCEDGDCRTRWVFQRCY